MDSSMPGFPTHHQLPELALIHVHWVESVMDISSSVVPFSSCLQCFPASASFPVSQFLASGGQSIGASALASVLPMNIQDWFPLGLIGWSPCSPRDSKSLLQHHSSKASILQHSAFFLVQLSCPYVTTKKTLTIWTFVDNVSALVIWNYNYSSW